MNQSITGVVHRDLPLDPLPQREQQCADQPLELPRRILDRAVGLRLIRGRRPEHNLHAQALGDSPGADPPTPAHR
eukprot:3067719-Alexandrium_andersonii.AAC.1